ncbi:protein spdB, partial [Kitasatospora sp. NPDC051170]
MSASIRQRTRRAALAAPALVSTLLSAVLTVAVVGLWLGTVMPVFLAVVIGLAFDAGWLCALAYERRLAAQGDHDRRVTALGWAFGLVATGMLVAHALTAPSGAVAWLAVAWLPVGAKA